MSKGLHDKYIATKTDGLPVDPDARYFVLRIDTDLCAWLALNTYAKAVEQENKELANDLFRMLRDVQARMQAMMAQDTDSHSRDVLDRGQF